MRWPDVIDEDATLDAVIGGKSIARYGDGELKLCFKNKDCISQRFDDKLAKELRQILLNPHPNCIVGTVPKKPSPKNWFWDKITKRPDYIKLHNPKIKYYSQWITRPDSAPWIDREDYWMKLFSIWRDKDVALVAGSHRSLTVEKLKTARSVQLIECMYRDTFQIVDQLEDQCLQSPHKVILLCCGATATVLANRLAAQGKHAIDLGHIGMFNKLYAKFGLE